MQKETIFYKLEEPIVIEGLELGKNVNKSIFFNSCSKKPRKQTDFINLSQDLSFHLNQQYINIICLKGVLAHRLLKIDQHTEFTLDKRNALFSKIPFRHSGIIKNATRELIKDMTGDFMMIVLRDYKLRQIFFIRE